MDIKEIPTEFIIYNVKDHLKHKKKLLKLIKIIPNNPYDQVSKTDWNLPKDFERKYNEYFYNHIAQTHANAMLKHFKCTELLMVNTWFQQYEKLSFHNYHVHPGVNLTNVYFLELPDSNFRTSIKVGEKEYEYKIEEGQIITFPAHLLHTSKQNGELRKTVIAFNSNINYGNINEYK
jgi:hypothetical protein|tara:strand:- start:204 stop:734 length:531 start_codon:yes stop_codon:yes gene_type:complete